MSKENVELVRRYYDLLNSRDLDGLSELLARDFELIEPSLPDGGAYLGPAGLRRWLERLDEAWSETRWDPQKFIDAGEYVVVPVRFVSRGAQTGIEQVSLLRFQTIRVEHDRITLATGYGKLANALEAVGLAE